jgi:hypothetical protein
MHQIVFVSSKLSVTYFEFADVMFEIHDLLRKHVLDAKYALIDDKGLNIKQ